MAQPAYGARNLIGADSSAGAATMIALSSAPASSSSLASATTVAMRWPIATYTETIPESLLLMIVSTAIVVLPVWRSPMISSRWPRPIGIIESTAFRPVCSGSLTGWRWTTPGALSSAGRVSDVSMSPLPSSGLPSGSTMRPSSWSPTGTSSRRFVRLTVSPSTIFVQSPNNTAPTLSDSRLRVRPVTSCGNSSISNDIAFSRPWTRAMPSATESTVPTSARSDWSVSRPSMRLLRIEVISSGLICMKKGSPCGRSRLPLGGARDLLAKLFQAVPDRRVEHGVADPHHQAAEDVGIDVRRQLDRAARLLPDAVADALDDLLVELHGRGDGDREELVLLVPERVELPPDAQQRRHPVVLDQQLEEVLHDRLGVRDRLVQPVLLLVRREVRREEEHLQVAVAVEGVGELADLLVDLVELVRVLRGLEERAGVDGGELLHRLLPPGPAERGEV